MERGSRTGGSGQEDAQDNTNLLALDGQEKPSFYLLIKVMFNIILY